MWAPCMCVQYIGGYHEYITGVGDIMMNVGGYHEYIGGCSVHWGNTMRTSGGYHEYIVACSVHRGIAWCMWGSKLIKSFQFLLKTLMYSWYQPRCTEHPPMYSWYPPYVLIISPNVLMVSLWCTEHPWCTYHHDIPRCIEYPPMYSLHPPNVLNIPRSTHDIPECTHGIPQCTKHPQCTEHPPTRVTILWNEQLF